jgi:2-methylisocitrate lyase-like PEP mutase family enzyme
MYFYNRHNFINLPTQKAKAEHLKALHYSGEMLVLPNIWDPLGALLLESLDYKAVATASAAIAYANGYHDGENIPLDELLPILKKIVDSVSIPVTADIESGYAKNEQELKANIISFLQCGIAGINIEDTNKLTGKLYTVEQQTRRIRIIREIAVEKDIPLFINARTDVYVHESDSGTSLLEQALERADAYKAAGADCFFPIALKDENEIESLVHQAGLPVNILAIPGIPALKTLHQIGVARVSLGPGFLKIAMQAMKNLAVQLQQGDGLEEITNNDITSDYLKKLINKDY